MSKQNRTEKRKQYQAFINTEPQGPRLGSVRAVKKWIRSYLRKCGKGEVDFGPISNTEGFIIEKEPSRFIDAPDHPLLHGHLYEGIIYNIKEV
jgi:hypothetical protein